jgi:hypothetical protein
MLNRIIILNSSTYGKATIRLDDCDSIQLVGPNNVGKSTLIFTLNFLFVIDGKKMTFVDNKTGDKETIHHYFPNPTNSYIIFEVFKQRYYCILLKRNSEGEIEYYKFDHEYNDKFFIRNENNTQIILKFEELRSQLIETGVQLQTFKDKREIFNFVYQRGKKNNGVVWLEDSVMSDGLSNNFSKVYRYLINSKLITNPTLKEALIIADNRDKEVLNFLQKSKKDINDLLRVNDEIKAISSIQKDFIEFREMVNQYKAKSKTLGELIFAFNSQYSPTLIELETQYFQKKKELETTQFELNEELIPKKQKLDREIGGKEVELKQIIEQQERYQKQINEINSFEGLPFLNQQFLNLDEKRKQIESSITRVAKYSVKQLEQRISELKTSILKLDNQIKGYSNQLIHKITTNQKDREILNTILSTDFSSLPSRLIEKQISQIGSMMNFFDGEIKLPTDLKGSPIASLEELTEKLKIQKHEQEEYEKLLPVAVDFEKAQKELQEINAQLSEIKLKISKIESKPETEKLLEQQKLLFKNISSEKIQKEKDLKTLSEEITRKSSSIQVITEARDKLDKRIEELKKWKEETEKINLEPISYDSSETLNHIYNKLNLIKNDREQLKINKDRAFDNLKYRIKSTIADEEEFIKFIQDEIACLSDKQKSVETILQAISTQFANPAHILLKRYGEFKEFITNKFNSKLARTSISDIESLKIVLNDNTKIIDDLKKISSIEEFTPQISFDFEKAENLKVLNHYLDSGKKIEFEELFDIELHLTKDEKEKKVDLKAQVESTGTDIMIRLVIIMSVINRLAINDRDNKITIAIDEIARIDGKNRLELFRFCKEHNFLPVCTSTEETILDGFDKHILLFRPQKGKKVNISEQSNVITQKNVEANEGA